MSDGKYNTSMQMDTFLNPNDQNRTNMLEEDDDGYA